MPRYARIVLPGIPHHITQRGVRRQTVFFEDNDYRQYLEYLSEYAQKYEVPLYAYCLMPNHVHHVAVPSRSDSLHKLFKSLHVKYAAFVNRRMEWTGHLWQARYYSSPLLDDRHAMAAVRYVEQNPVAASMVSGAAEYRWSSARAHCQRGTDEIIVRRGALPGCFSNIAD